MNDSNRYMHIERILQEHGKKASKVLEIGCGGAPYRGVFQNYIGSDLLSTSYSGKDKIDVFCDGQVLPFKSDSFDLVFMVACFYQIPDSKRVLEECRRVLNEGGELLLFDYNYATTKKLKRLEGNGVNKNHVWSPLKLVSVVKQMGFNSCIVYDCFEDSANPIKKICLKFKILKYLLFFLKQILLLEGWNVVRGIKKAQCI